LICFDHNHIQIKEKWYINNPLTLRVCTLIPVTDIIIRMSHYLNKKTKCSYNKYGCPQGRGRGGPWPDYCSNAVTWNGVTVFVTFSVLFCVFDYISRRVIVTVIKYNYFHVFAKVFRYFFKYSVLLENIEVNYWLL
jgi:hypothetical protein